MSGCAPILLFVYHRLDHTRQTIEALQKNHLAADSLLIVYSDAASKKEHEAGVQQVRNYLSSINGFIEVKIILQPVNKGLAKSIVDGVAEQINIHGRAIVLEDDLITSPYFLKYMNAALELYEKEEKVMQVTGFCFPVTGQLPSTYFVKLTSSWGWATWKRAWDTLSMDTEAHIHNIEKNNLVAAFDVDGGMGYFSHLLMNREGTMKTWAVKWYATVFLQDGLCLYPSKTLVKNIGHDGSGENSLQNLLFSKHLLYEREIVVERIKIKEDLRARKIISSFLRLMNGTPSKLQTLRNKIKDKIKYELGKLLGRKR
ncbi:MAG: hypothetical protein ACKOXB_02995 [Flavobacteriales bacterium]